MTTEKSAKRPRVQKDSKPRDGRVAADVVYGTTVSSSGEWSSSASVTTATSSTTGVVGNEVLTTNPEGQAGYTTASQTSSPVTSSRVVTTALGQTNEYPQSKVERRVIGYISEQD